MRLKRKIRVFLMMGAAVLGTGMILYPDVSDRYNSLHQSKVIAGYEKAVHETDSETCRRLYEQAQAYNRQIAVHGIEWEHTPEETEEYLQTYDLTGTGMMGYLKIAEIHVSLPVCHSAEEAVLQVAVGHIEGSSLPVGGEGTHCLLSGHTGLPERKLFTDLDRLETGDTFQIVTLGRTLTYEVDDIRTVLPWELESLVIEEGKDLCTLITCTPYGINTHRLLVRGHRIMTAEEQVLTEDIRKEEEKSISCVYPAASAVLICMYLLVRKQK